jgi:DNA-binding NtrC family response regulator
VRELAAVLERAAILGNGKRLEVAAALGVGGERLAPTARHDRGQAPFGAAAAAAVPSPPSPATLADLERRHIEETLARAAGRVEGPFGAARVLGINPNTLRGRMRKLGIDPQRFRH